MDLKAIKSAFQYVRFRHVYDEYEDALMAIADAGDVVNIDGLKYVAQKSGFQLTGYHINAYLNSDGSLKNTVGAQCYDHMQNMTIHKLLVKYLKSNQKLESMTEIQRLCIGILQMDFHGKRNALSEKSANEILKAALKRKKYMRELIKHPTQKDMLIIQETEIMITLKNFYNRRRQLGYDDFSEFKTQPENGAFSESETPFSVFIKDWRDEWNKARFYILNSCTPKSERQNEMQQITHLLQ